MAISITDILALVKELISDGDKMSKFKDCSIRAVLIFGDKDDKNVYFFDEFIIKNTTTQRIFRRVKLEVRKNPLKRSKVLSAFWTPLISESKDFKEGKSKKHAIEEFIRRYPNHKGDLIINGDASGDNRTAQSEFTNYMIIKRALEAHGYNPKFRLRDFNPAILRRIQAFNAKVRNSKGDVSLFIDKRCKWLLHNVYNLSFKEGTSIVDVPSLKQIKNDHDLKFLEHPFDAASYLVDYYFPIK